jgi:hypothetical protein
MKEAVPTIILEEWDSKIIIEPDTTIFSWNDDAVEEWAKELGEKEFPNRDHAGRC